MNAHSNLPAGFELVPGQYPGQLDLTFRGRLIAVSSNREELIGIASRYNDSSRRAFLSRPIATNEQATAWMAELADRGMDFHFEDSPETVISARGRLFTDEEVPLVKARVDELYALDWSGVGCPIGEMLRVLEEKGR